MMTFDEGLIKTCRFPRFSALQIDFRQSLSTLTRTMVPTNRKNNYVYYILIVICFEVKFSWP